MKRRLFLLFSALSLLAALLLSLLALRSLWIRDTLGLSFFRGFLHDSCQTDYTLCSDHAGLLITTTTTHLQYKTNPNATLPRQGPPWVTWAKDEPASQYPNYLPNQSIILNRLGFVLARHSTQLSDPGSTWSRTGHSLVLPIWPLIVALLLLPVYHLLLMLRRRHRLRHNLCAICGYDLRASQGRCPECGTPMSPTAFGGGEIARIS